MENKNIIAALFKAQQQISPPEKDKQNPMFKSKYASLDSILHACRGPLFDNGLLLTQDVETDAQGRHCVVTTLYHTSGEKMVNRFPMTIEKPTNHGVGSARTYACRYSISNLLALPTDEDDDANGASLTDEQLIALREKLRGDSELESRIVKGYNKINPKIRSLRDIPSAEYEKIATTLDKRKMEAVS